MTLDPASNFARDTLQSDITDTDTVISVADASQFPDTANGSFNVVLWDSTNYRRPGGDPSVEIVRVTGRDTTNNELTISRAQEGTAAASHSTDDAVSLTYTAKFRDDIQSQVETKLESSNYNPETDTHDKYTDSEARTAVNNSDVEVTGLVLPVGTDKWV